ncbi:MAG: hypothetical protein JXB23_01015 [Candidatus Aminicenantes bacterium]|nr:hypothetical protein [Candidatus Aminicenantes bacterium]
MKEIIVEKVGDVKIYGKGDLGGKGSGLVKINERSIPNVHKLRTRILTTVFYDRFFEEDGRFGKEDLETFASILKKLENIPISVRSSATNEAYADPGGDFSVHAGENRSFMLPNSHPDFSVRFDQLVQAVSYIYHDFKQQQPPESREKMAVVINPIPGIQEESLAGPVYYPMVSGVANSFFPYALKSQKADEGFARLAFGHGYATVMDEFPVISMATIQNPIPVRFMGEGQKYFYAIDMTQNTELQGDELETMKKLHVRFADSKVTRRVGRFKNAITLEDLVHKNHFGFRAGLLEIMNAISSIIRSQFQIEFVFNFDRSADPNRPGTFHVVQLTQLPTLTFEKVLIPETAKHTYLEIHNLQGHGMKKGIRHALIVSPFIYRKDMHDNVVKLMSRFALTFSEKKEGFIILIPGRLGTKNRDWGIQVDFKDIGRPAAIFEYGVDIAGRPEPVHDTLTGGGIYGSHFLYMLQGGHDEEKKRIQTRMFGTQGTHFLTNLMSNRIVYGYVAPLEDRIDPWFFSPKDADEAIYILSFPQPVSIYADSINQKCVIIEEEG